MQGWADSPLTEEGESQADAAGRGMKDILFSTAFSSDLGRQRATAKHILAQNEGDIPELQEVIGLREEFYGGFEGKPDEQLWRPIYEANGVSYDEKESTYLNLLVPEQYQGEHIPNCSVTVLTYKDGVYGLEACADVSYLENGKK